ncbi:MAG: aldehyde ferredoxin oxidoreductase family protein, partial [Thermoplasmata archaeon]
MMNGYAGSVLFVDLTTGKTKSEETNWAWAEKYIGGKGLGARYLFDLLKPGVDPLSPENVLMFMTGPLSGTLVPAFAKYTTISKSPATGTFLDCYVGGRYMAEMKFAGFDAFIFLGRAQKPSYVHIGDGQAEVRDGTHLWGKGALETTNTLKEELENPSLKVATVGPAGENLVRFACITSELSATSSHQGARGGIGAVMGSKNLKAVTVFGTDREQNYADPDGFREFHRETVKKEIVENEDVDWARNEGTPIIVADSQETGLLPTQNFQEGRFDQAEDIDSDAMRERIFVKKTNCFRCPISCRNISEVRTGPFKGLTIEGPEYETIAMTGSNCGIGDLNLIVKFNSLCDDLGLDTMSAGAVTAFAMECYERGIV